MLGCEQLQGSSAVVRKRPLFNSRWSCRVLVWLPGREQTAQALQRGTGALGYGGLSLWLGGCWGWDKGLQHLNTDAPSLLCLYEDL